MQVSKIDSQNFGMTIQLAKRRTNAQKHFMNEFVDYKYRRSRNTIYDLDCALHCNGIGDVLVKETEDGNTKIVVKMKNIWGQNVKNLATVFEMSKTNMEDIKEQMNSFLANARLQFGVVRTNASRSPRVLRQLIEIAQKADDIENGINCY